MGFVNEKISQDDVDFYFLDEVDAKLFSKIAFRSQWTIDREKDMYLRRVVSGREEFSNCSDWHFYWHGKHVIFSERIRDAEGVYGGPASVTREISSLKADFESPDQQEELLNDLKEAFEAFGDGGMYSTASSCATKIVFR